LMRASDKVTGLNAYVTGIGSSKRVVVWDTTIAKCPTEEILFIFGHEQGHYVLNHIWIGLTASAVGSLVALWLGFHVVQWIVARWGRAWGVTAVDDWAAIAVLLLVSAIFGFFGDPVSNAFSRLIEHHADIYGQEVIHGLVADPRRTAAEAFQKIGELSLDEPDPDHFLVFWSYSHPSISRRQRFAARYDPWLDGGRPRYFSKGADRW
jgi:STE24 endopeptidase